MPTELWGKGLALLGGRLSGTGRKSACSLWPAAGKSSNCCLGGTLGKGLQPEETGNGFLLAEGRLRWHVELELFPARVLGPWLRLV